MKTTWVSCFRTSSALAVLMATSSQLRSFTKQDNVYMTDGSLHDVQAAVNHADDNDIIRIPAGSFTWGENATRLFVTKPVLITGDSQATTTINFSPTGPTFQTTVINLLAPATFRSLTINGHSSVPAFGTSTANGWRISEITYNPGVAAAYFCLFSTYGLIDKCTITGASGTNELIFGRGPTNSWQTPSTLGGPENVFVEDCTFNGPGYVCDANSNARIVVRFCLITGNMKIDGHGLATNGPPRSVRHMEVYRNRWTTVIQPALLMELRGGTGFVFDNSSENLVSGIGWFMLAEYGFLSPFQNFGGEYQTLADYPITDQIGVGMDPKVAASEPMYLWNNRAAATNNAGAATVNWTIIHKAVPSGAITRYQVQTGNPNAAFRSEDIIKADRDYFTQIVGTVFDGTSGVGVGTRLQMIGIQPTKQGVGFWVTDEGEWNAANPGPDGQFYVWDGSNWTLKYVPYTYPHPRRRPIAPSKLRVAP